MLHPPEKVEGDGDIWMSNMGIFISVCDGGTPWSGFLVCFWGTITSREFALRRHPSGLVSQLQLVN